MISFFSDLDSVTYFNASLALQGRALPAAGLFPRLHANSDEVALLCCLAQVSLLSFL